MVTQPLPSCSPSSNPQHCALIVGHPGHELKVFGWMCEHKPRVYMITDGSGRHGIPRTLSTAALITQLGCEPGEVFGAISDAQIYQAMLERDYLLFLELVDQLAESFVRHEVELVAGDAAEGFNPTHDLCRALINAAVLMAQRATGKTLGNLEFSLTEWERNAPAPTHDDRCLHWTLDDHLLAKKIAAAQDYVELKNEVQRALAHRGKEYFRVECMRNNDLEALPRWSNAPDYESWGERHVAAGEYPSVIRFKQHILPITEAILNYAVHATMEPHSL